MSIRKILLKDDAGKPLSSLTLPFRAGELLSLPAGMAVDAYEEREILFPAEKQAIRLTSDPPTISLIGRLGKERVFGTTLPEEKATFVKWKLLCALQERQTTLGQVPKSPLTALEKEPAPLATEKEEPAPLLPSETADEQEAQPLATEGETPVTAQQMADERLAHAEKLLQNGEPFDLFTELMPNTRWAKIKEEEYEYLVGITEDAPPRVLYGIAGMLDYPPDADRVWTFFPTSENGEEGYYLTPAEEC